MTRTTSWIAGVGLAVGMLLGGCGVSVHEGGSPSVDEWSRAEAKRLLEQSEEGLAQADPELLDFELPVMPEAELNRELDRVGEPADPNGVGFQTTECQQGSMAGSWAPLAADDASDDELIGLLKGYVYDERSRPVGRVVGVFGGSRLIGWAVKDDGTALYRIEGRFGAGAIEASLTDDADDRTGTLEGNYSAARFVAKWVVCEQEPQSCFKDSQCDEDQFCEFAGCVVETGKCVARPSGCYTDEVAPVCGCDGRTHMTRCWAHLEGVSIRHDGACEQEPRSCFKDNQCDEDQFCEFAGCVVETGKCVARPSGCYTDEVAPVCGCDGQTHMTRCEAHLEGVSIRHDGACEPQQPQCKEHSLRTDTCLSEQELRERAESVCRADTYYFLTEFNLVSPCRSMCGADQRCPGVYTGAEFVCCFVSPRILRDANALQRVVARDLTASSP